MRAGRGRSRPEGPGSGRAGADARPTGPELTGAPGRGSQRPGRGCRRRRCVRRGTSCRTEEVGRRPVRRAAAGRGSATRAHQHAADAQKVQLGAPGQVPARRRHADHHARLSVW
ncbi:hypothetical protein [Ornithinimicrobium kibberense]|uniref:hypothetical protein n=1 Tax=Ornithinimicrobium kibberense TaxID=282060 RepID=UPI00360931A7